MPASNFFGAITEGLDWKAKREEQNRLNQLRGATQSAAQGGLGSDAFKNLAGMSPDAATKLKSVLQTDDQGLDAAFQDAAVFQNLLQNDPTGQSALQFGRSRLQSGASQGRNMLHTERFLGEIQADPLAALNSIGSFLSIPNQIGQGKAKDTDTADIKNFNMLEELKKTGSPEQVAAFKKMTGLLSDPKMSASLEKQIVKSQDDFFKFSEQARQMDVLANDIGRMSIGGGLASTVSETFKNILGSQDDVTSLRRRFNAIRTSQATSNLPPGPASDKDIQMALSGFPPENANADIITSFLRGQQKLAKVNEKFAEFKSNFYAVNKSPSGLLPAWKNYAENNEMFGDGGASNPASTGNSLNFDAQGNLIQ